MSISFPLATQADKQLVGQIYQRLRLKRSAEFEASRLGISTDTYLLIRSRIQEALDQAQVEDSVEAWLLSELGQQTPSPFSVKQQGKSKLTTHHNVDTRVTETKEDLEAGTGSIKGISVTEPRSAEEVIAVLRLDTAKWRLVQYWNKEKNGRWEISALVARRKSSDALLPEDISESLRRVFFKPILSQVLPAVNVVGGALVLYAADKHVAADVSKVAMYGNRYSVDIYRERMRLLLDEVHYLVARSGGAFKRIIYVDMGDHTDGLDGKTVSKTHHLPQNLSNRETFDACLSVEKEFLDALFASGCAQSYVVLQNANSNHSGDFDYFVAAHVQQYVNLRYPEVETRILQKFIEHYEYGDHTILFCHGKDDGDMKHGLPKHLNEKTENYIRKYLQFHQIDIKKRVVTFAKADLHQNASEQVYGLRYRNVSSLFGSSKWIQTNFGPGSPGCSYDLLEEEGSRVWEGLLQFRS